MPFTCFPFNFIYWDKVSDHQEIKEKYLPLILETNSKVEKRNKWRCEVTTSYMNDDINNTLFDDHFIQTVVWKKFDEFLENKPPHISIPKESYIQNIWYNYYTPGQYQEIHQHLSAHNIVTEKGLISQLFSGIYLIDLQEKNKTVFYQPGPLPSMPTPESYTITTEHIEEGNVIFFPSSTPHYVLPCENPRVTISFNIVSVF